MNSTSPKATSPLHIGWLAVKANFIPGLIVQGLMVAVLLAYYLCEPARNLLLQIADLKRENGFLFSFLLGTAAGAFLSELLAILVFQNGKVTLQNGKNLLFFIPFWGGQAMIVDAFYQLQTMIFGSGGDFLTVLKKVLLDQLGYSPFFAIPFALAGLAWKEGGYRLSAVRPVFTASYMWERGIPTLLTNWAVWFPVVCIVYSLPEALQVPFFGFALTFWVMVLTWISRQKQ